MPWVLGEAGLLCEPGDARDLADQALRLLQDDALRDEMIRRGLKRAREFSPESYEEGLLKAIASLAQPVLPSDLRSIPLGSVGAPEIERKLEAMLVDDVRELAAYCDVALRDYVVRSKLPLVGPLIAWIRRNLTSHLREPYLDPMIERQVEFNRRVADLLWRMSDLQTGRLRRGMGRSSRVDASKTQSLGAESEASSMADWDARLRLIERRLDLLSAQMTLLEAECAGQPDDPRVVEARRQVEALRVAVSSSQAIELP